MSAWFREVRITRRAWSWRTQDGSVVTGSEETHTVSGDEGAPSDLLSALRRPAPSRARNRRHLVLALVGGGALFGLMMEGAVGGFFPSQAAAWGLLAASAAASLALTSQAGAIDPGLRRLGAIRRSASYLIVGILIGGMAFLLLKGTASAMNRLVGRPGELRVRVSELSQGGRCRYRVAFDELRGVGGWPAPLCRSREEYATLSVGAPHRIAVRRSWLGVTVR